MDLKVRLYLERAENEFRLAKAIFALSLEEKIKIDLGANPKDTFYSSVISHCYFAIFYCAKAILLTKGIEAKAPEEHKKTLEQFKRHFVDTGELDSELLQIYDKMVVRANELLGLFEKEKRKRGHFTYKTIAQANIEPAEESIANAKRFIASIKQVIKTRQS